MKQETHQLEITDEIPEKTELCLPAETIPGCMAHLTGRDGTELVQGPAQTKNHCSTTVTGVRVTGRHQSQEFKTGFSPKQP